MRPAWECVCSAERRQAPSSTRTVGFFNLTETAPAPAHAHPSIPPCQIGLPHAAAQAEHSHCHEKHDEDVVSTGTRCHGRFLLGADTGCWTLAVEPIAFHRRLLLFYLGVAVKKQSPRQKRRPALAVRAIIAANHQDGPSFRLCCVAFAATGDGVTRPGAAAAGTATGLTEEAGSGPKFGPSARKLRL